MRRLTERKTRLIFTTASTVRYKGREREIVVDAQPDFCAVRLIGTRTRYEASWRSIFTLAAEIYAQREKERRRAAKRKGKGV